MQFCNRNPNINSISGSSNNNDDGDYNDNDCESDISSMTMTEHGLQRQLQHHSVLSLHNQLFDVVFNAADDIGNNDACYDNDDDTIANDDVWVVYVVDNIIGCYCSCSQRRSTSPPTKDCGQHVNYKLLFVCHNYTIVIARKC